MDEMKNNDSIKAKSRIIIPAAVLIALVLLLVGVAAVTGKLGGNGKKEVTNAMMATFTRSGGAIREIWAVDEYKGMFEDRQMSIDADLTVTGGINLDMQYNMDDTVSSLNMNVRYYGGSLIEALFYMDKEELRLGFPYITNYVFYVDRTTLEEDIQSMVEAGVIDEEAAKSIIMLNQNEQDLTGAGEEIRQGGRELLEAVKAVYNKAEVKKADGRMLEVNDGDKSCKGYVMAVTGEQIADFFIAYKEVYEKNKSFQNYFNQLMAQKLEYDSAEELLEEIDPAEEFLKLADEAAGMEENIEIYFYLCDGAVARIYCEKDKDNYIAWDIKGGNFPLENTELTIAADGYDRLFFSRSGSLENDKYTADYSMDLEGEELNLEMKYDRGSGNFDLAVSDYYSEFTLSGNIDRTIPGSELMLEIDSFEADYSEVFYGDITISNECGAIERPEGETLNIMTMTEDDWNDIMAEMIAEILYSMY